MYPNFDKTDRRLTRSLLCLLLDEHCGLNDIANEIICDKRGRFTEYRVSI